MNFLDGSDEGDISDVLELNSDFVVLEVLEVTPEGYRPFDEVRTQVENLVKIERRKELTEDRVKGLLDQYQTLEAIAEQTDQEVQTQNNLRANATVIQGAGREPMVIGAVLSLEEGQTSDVLVGNSAAFIVEVVNKETADLANLDPQTRNEIRQRLEQQKFQEFNSIWLEQLKADAKIVDNRDRLLQ
jgi:parvulin-like peptidyl-prolyl isomerase